MSDTRKPDYVLRIKDHRGKSARVGAAWKNDGGYLNLQINPGVVLDWRALDGCLVTLFPNDGRSDS